MLFYIITIKLPITLLPLALIYYDVLCSRIVDSKPIGAVSSGEHRGKSAPISLTLSLQKVVLYIKYLYNAFQEQLLGHRIWDLLYTKRALPQSYYPKPL